MKIKKKARWLVAGAGVLTASAIGSAIGATTSFNNNISKNNSQELKNINNSNNGNSLNNRAIKKEVNFYELRNNENAQYGLYIEGNKKDAALCVYHTDELIDGGLYLLYPASFDWYDETTTFCNVSEKNLKPLLEIAKNNPSVLPNIIKSTYMRNYFNGKENFVTFEGQKYETFKLESFIYTKSGKPIPMSDINIELSNIQSWPSIGIESYIKFNFKYNNSVFFWDKLHIGPSDSYPTAYTKIQISTGNEGRPEVFFGTIANDFVAKPKLSNYSSAQLISNENNCQDILKQQMVQRKDEIFSNYPTDSIINSNILIKEVVEGPSPDSVAVSFTLSKAYLDEFNNQGNQLIGPKDFTINVSGLKAFKTVYNYKTEWYTNQNFNSIFPGASKFVVDWRNKNLESKYINNLKTSIKNNINYYFANPYKTNLEDIIPAGVNGSKFQYYVKYSGTDIDSASSAVSYNPSMQSVATINLATDITQVGFYDQWKQTVQEWIDLNKKVPTDDDIKQLAFKYANDRKKLLPESTQDLDKNHVVGSNLVDDSNLPDIKINPVTINTSPLSINFPQISVKLNATELKDEFFNATGKIKSYSAQKLIALAADGDLSNSELIDVKNWISDNSHLIFTVIPNGNVFTLKKVEAIPNMSDAIKVTVNLSRAYTQHGIQSMDFVFQIRDFKGTSTGVDNVTSLKITSIDWDSSLFREIWPNNKGYGVDWEKNLSQESQQAISWFQNSNNLNRILNNPIDSTIKVNALDTMNGQNKAYIDLSYSGIDETGAYNSNINGTITVNLRPAPGTDTDGDGVDDSGFFNGLKDAVQNWIDQNKKVPTDEELKGIINDYLNDNNSNLPDSMQKNPWSPSDITISAGAINTSRLPKIDIIGDKVTINTPNGSMNIPNISVSLSNTSCEASVRATNPIATLNAQELIALASTGNLSDAKIQKVNEWINDNVDTIFNFYVPGARYTLKSLTSVANDNNAISVTVTASKAIEGTIVQNKDFGFNITNFSSDGQLPQTEQKFTTISWDDSTYKSIFGSSDKGFTVDWQNNLSTYKNTITTYLTNESNVDKIFINPLNTSVRNVNASVNASNNQATVTFNYSGINASGNADNNMSGTITINLRPTPGPDPDENDPTKNPLAGFKDVLQQWVNANHRFPSNNELKKIVSDYLNNKKNELPNSCIPSGGSFDANDINVGSIDKTDEIININKGTISTATNPSLQFPDMVINVPITKQINTSLDISSEAFANYVPSELAAIFNDGSQNPSYNKVIEVYNYLKSQKDTIFSNAPSDAIIDSIVNMTANGSNLVIEFNLTKVYEVNAIANNIKFTVTLTGFNTANIKETTLKSQYQNMKYDSTDFKDIFGDNCFWDDWATNIVNIKNTLMEALNNDISKYFQNPADITSVSNVSIVNVNTDDAKATITFSGFDANKNYSNNLTATINFDLKQTPGSGTGPDITDPDKNTLAGFKDFLQQKVNVDKVFPKTQKLQQYVAEFLNQPGIVPNAWRPNGGFSEANVIIDSSLIDTSTTPVTINSGAIKFTKKDNTKVNIPECTIDVPMPIAQNIDATAPINAYLASEIITAFSYNNNSDPKVLEVIEWIKANTNNIFTNLRNNSVISEVVNMEQVNNVANAIKVTVRLTNGGVVDGEIGTYSFIINNFKTDNTTTSLKITTISALENGINNDIFKAVFGNDKGFAIDWSKQDLTAKQNALKDYINAHKDIFFENTTNVNVSNVVMTMDGNNCNASITFSGLSNGNLVNDMNGTIVINLKPTPGTDGDGSGVNDDWLQDGIKDAIQDAINKNDGILPDQDKIEDAVNEWLDQNKDKFPDASIPGGADGSFSPNGSTVTMPDNPENSTDGIITIPGVEVGTGSNAPIEVPSITVTTKKTIAIDNISVAGSDIETLSPSAIVSEFASNPNNENVDKILSFLNANISRIFTKDLKSGATINDISNIQAGSNEYSLFVTMTLSEAYDVTQILTNKAFTIELTNFAQTSIPTTAKDVTISALNDIAQFNDAFNNFSGFLQDWQLASDQQLATLKASLESYMNNNVNLFLNDPIANSEIKITNFPTNSSSIISTFFTINYSFKGLDDRNNIVDKNASINIELLDANSDPVVVDVIAGIQKVVQDYVDANGYPTKNEHWAALTDKIADYLNTNKNNLPSAWIPDDGNFNGSDININMQEIDDANAVHGTVTFNQGAITTNKGIANQVFDISIAKSSFTQQISSELSVKGSSLDEYLAQYVANEINNGASSAMKSMVEQYINANKFKFLKNANEADIVINNATFNSSEPTSVILDITVNKANLVSGVGSFNTTIKLIDFKDNNDGSLNTDLKVTELNLSNNADLKLFQSLFNSSTVDLNKGFGLDWLNYDDDTIIKSTNEMKQGFESNINDWFNNPIPSVQNMIKSVVPEPCDSNIGSRNSELEPSLNKYVKEEVKDQIIMKINVTFTGIEGTTTKDITRQIKITFKNFNRDDSNGIFAGLGQYIQDQCSEFPSPDELKPIIAGYLNNNSIKQQIPNILIPENGIGQYKDANILIDENNPAHQEGNSYTIPNGCIKVQVTDQNGKAQEFNVPEFSVTINSINVAQEDTNWIVWLVVGLSAGILAITVIVLVLYIIKRKRNDDSSMLDMGF